MPKRAKELSALEVARIKLDGLHAVGGVAGLVLQVVGAARSWILRFSLNDARRQMGLGAYPEIGVGEARKLAASARDLIRHGVDPIDTRRSQRIAVRSAEEAHLAALKTFREVAVAYVAAKQKEWKNAKHRLQWGSTLETYAYPMIGDLVISDVDTPHILGILEPLWQDKTETAARLRGRLEVILDYAAARKYREGPNPARWRGHLALMLASPRKVIQRQHHAAIDYREMPTFMARLRTVEGDSAAALDFAIVTAARSGEVRGAVWDEFDLNERTWTIPGSRMKAGKAHRVPLSTQALRILLARNRDTGFVFSSARTGKQLSDMSLTLTVRRMKVDAVPHGLARATFKTWATECTSYPREVIEAALAHTLENKTEEAYWRGDLYEKRSGLMSEWGSFLSQPEKRN